MGKDLLEKIQVLQFRKDINFLRALSVVSVIIYHIEKSFLPGGWLGVDIFFFISGYLISNKIIIELKNNNFQFRNFYLKRIKRNIASTIFYINFYNSFCILFITPKGIIFVHKQFSVFIAFLFKFLFRKSRFLQLTIYKVFSTFTYVELIS